MREIYTKFALMTLAKYKNQQSNEIYSKLTIKTPKQHPWRCSDVFTVNSGQVNCFDQGLLQLPGVFDNLI